MLDEANRLKRQVRRRRFVVGLFCFGLLFSVWTWRSQHRWIDPRFVGAWRVTHNKADDVEVYLLNLDGSGTRLVHNGTNWSPTFNFRYGWRIGREGFHFGNNPGLLAQLAEYVGDLGGFRSAGRVQRFRYYGGMPGELVSVTSDKIVLRFSREGIIKPDELTLTRMAPEDVPEWRK
ncbi:MAG TPA: hypothetical protein VM452_15545 [Caulifigura sp.]|jgi:hypothetical protein|nr:hypothetical protein [Caulifigura sp.]